MFIRRLDDIRGTDREVVSNNWTSRRLLLADDDMGFSLHDTLIHAGTSTEMHYQNHLEAVYCVEGRGRVKDRGTGEIFEIRPGTAYALNGHEQHILTADVQMRMVCVFNPALVGREHHDENGVYPLLSTTEVGANQ